MRRMTIRDVRLHWREAEKALAQGEEITVTRDGSPVARILAYVPPETSPGQRFDATAHMAWLSRFWKGKGAVPSSDALLSADRAE